MVKQPAADEGKPSAKIATDGATRENTNIKFTLARHQDVI